MFIRLILRLLKGVSSGHIALLFKRKNVDLLGFDVYCFFFFFGGTARPRNVTERTSFWTGSKRKFTNRNLYWNQYLNVLRTKSLAENEIIYIIRFSVLIDFHCFVPK